HSSRIKVASFASGLSGKQIVVWPDRSGYGFAYSFDKGISAGYQLWMSSYIDEAEIGYPPEVAIADMDLDGLEDIVIATYGRVVVFDGNTGMRISSGGWIGEVRWISGPGIDGRNYGTLQIVQFPGNPYPGIVILADADCLHVAVIVNG